MLPGVPGRMEQKNRRKRPVALNQDARKMLEAALLERYSQEGSSLRLTRETRAEYLGLSVVTVNRILNGKGVDRATLVHAFKSVGLPWSDSYCVPGDFNDLSPNPPEAVTIDTGTFSTRWTPTVGLGAALISIVAILGYAIQMKKSMAPAEQITPASRIAFNTAWNRCKLNYDKGQYQGALKCAREVAGLARAEQNGSQLASALRLEGDILAALGEDRDAIRAFKEAYELRKVLNQTTALPAILEALGEIENRTGSTAKARRHLEECARLFLDQADPIGAAMAYRNLGSVEHCAKNYSSARRYFSRSLELLGGKGKPEMEYDVLSRMALLKADIGDPIAARKELESCLSYWELNGHPRWIARSRLNLAKVLIIQREYEVARRYLQQSLGAYRQVGDKKGQLETQQALDSIILTSKA